MEPGLGHLPVDIPREDLINGTFRLCMQGAVEEATLGLGF